MVRVVWMLPCFLSWKGAVVVVNGFANNLVNTRSGCMIELDTSEVIMNNVVRSPNDSDFPKMHLAVVENDNHMESPYHYHQDEKMMLDNNDQQQLLQLSIAFVNPYSTTEFKEDLQFVMEVDGRAEFVAGGTIGCEGNKRVSARLMDIAKNNGGVTLQLHDTSATVKVWAGWATGHSAVRLTPTLLLEPSISYTTTNEAEDKLPPKEGANPEEKKRNEEEKKAVNDRVADEMSKLKSKDRSATIKRSKAKGSASLANDDVDDSEKAAERRMAHKKQKEAHKKQKDKSHKREKKDKEKGEDTITHRNRETAKKVVAERRKAAIEHESDVAAADIREDVDDSTDDEEELEPIPHGRTGLDAAAAEQKRRKEMDGIQIKSFRGRYQSDDFANRLDMSSYVYACVFFLFSIGFILIGLGKRREKGRREL